ncbi:hypothetical protein SuNHUV7_02900 (plasmid) [Pseudoseohaeicola sp. NH-UV-7]|uniref:hypothetical protein n=1 Tax=unclassified Sulfitobacter TaxID=196795 RepID=UPI000E0A84F8|nr:hypothetical protein [Sulfitobacter sp. JL08]AXI53861.1 hypothetical protein C1J05_04520 [Sulfitobacter sp. JL08]
MHYNQAASVIGAVDHPFIQTDSKLSQQDRTIMTSCRLSQFFIVVWRPGIREHIEIELDALFAMLKKNDAYFLPARFPDTGLERNHKAFFERVVATNGKCFEN